MKLFPAERKVLEGLIDEWYEAVQKITAEADKIFSDKGKQYDVASPVWERMRFPYGFTHEITKKANRVEQLFEPLGNGTDITETDLHWEDIQEELQDIMNYARMLAGLNAMLLERKRAHDCDCDCDKADVQVDKELHRCLRGQD
jgi:NTP pyrophosphatase (non-canonical NTP hydrolase)